MSNYYSIFLSLAIVCSAGLTHANQKISQLFSNDDILSVIIRSDFPYREMSKLKQQSDQEKEFEYSESGSIIYEDNGNHFESFIKIEARGSGRLSHCDFPPIKLNFPKNNGNAGIFENINKLKLVTHCDEGRLIGSTEKNRNQLVPMEFALYKMLEKFLPFSFQTRLFKVRYEKNNGDKVAEALAFAIEPKSNFVKRNIESVSSFIDDTDIELIVAKILKKIEVVSSADQQAKFDHELYSLVDISYFIESYLGQLLILNGDWASILWGGNIQAFQKKDGKILSVHYDFDLSLMIEKFNLNPNRKNDHGHQFPASIESDILIIDKLCHNEAKYVSEDFQKAKIDLLPYCKKIIPNILNRKSAVLASIQSIDELSSENKEKIKDRTVTFFESLSKYYTEVLNK